MGVGVKVGTGVSVGTGDGVIVGVAVKVGDGVADGINGSAAAIRVMNLGVCVGVCLIVMPVPLPACFDGFSFAIASLSRPLLQADNSRIATIKMIQILKYW